MGWMARVQEIEALEDVEFDPDLVGEMERAAHQRGGLPPIRFSTPTFKEYSILGNQRLRQEFLSGFLGHGRARARSTATTVRPRFSNR